MLHASYYRHCSARAGHAILRSNALPIQLPIQLRKQTTSGSPQPYKKKDSLLPKDTPAPEKETASEVLKPSLHPINPPSSTLPPPLDLPTRSPSTSKASHLLSVGRTYLAFYKTGLKALYQNTKLIRASTNPAVSLFASESSLQTALAEHKITRADFHLITRTQSDALRIPLFTVVLMCCGEFTPLLVPFISPVIPKCVWLPVQWEKMRRKQEERRRWWADERKSWRRPPKGGGRTRVKEEGGQAGSAAPAPAPATSTPSDATFGMKPSGKDVHVSRDPGVGQQAGSAAPAPAPAPATSTPPDASLGIKPSGKDVDITRYYGLVGARINAWSWFLDRAFSWYTPFALLQQLTPTARTLMLDDLAIKREGGVAALVDEEVKMAMDARGKDVLGKGVQEMRDALAQSVETHDYIGSDILD